MTIKMRTNISETRNIFGTPKPCPFCGGTDIEARGFGLPDYDAVYGRCNICGATGPRVRAIPNDTPEDFFNNTKWNQRVSP